MDRAIEFTGIRQVKIPVSDLAVSARWYRKAFGLDLVAEFVEGADLVGAVLAERSTGLRVALRVRSAIPGGPDLAGLDVTGLEVAGPAEIEALAERLRSAGIDFSGPAPLGPGLLHVDVPDPDGTVIRVVTPPVPGPFVGVEVVPGGPPTLYDRPRLELD